MIKPFGIIYMAKHKKNGKVYIGQTKNTLKHRSYDKNNFTGRFADAIHKYGKDAFEWSVVLECFSQKELNDKEEFFISHHNSIDPKHGYNVRFGGGPSGIGSGTNTAFYVSLATKQIEDRLRSSLKISRSSLYAKALAALENKINK